MKNTIKNNKLVMVGFTLLLILIIVAKLAPYLGLESPTILTNDVFALPSKKHLLGTNDIGQDIFARIIYGLRFSLLISFSVGFLSTFIAITLGAIAAMENNLLDRILLRVCDVFLAIPKIIIALLIASYLKPSIYLVILLITSLSWQGQMKIIRAQILIILKKEYVLATKMFGASQLYIFIKHILPEIAPLIISIFIKNARMAVFMEVGLSYLGVMDSSIISFGKIMNNAMEFMYLDVFIWWILPTGFLLSIFLMSLSYLGYYFELERN